MNGNSSQLNLRWKNINYFGAGCLATSLDATMGEGFECTFVCVYISNIHFNKLFFFSLSLSLLDKTKDKTISR